MHEDAFKEYFKDFLFKQLAVERGYTKEDFIQNLEQLIFVHLYLATANEIYSADEVLKRMKEAMPPIEALQRIMKRCT